MRGPQRRLQAPRRFSPATGLAVLVSATCTSMLLAVGPVWEEDNAGDAGNDAGSAQETMGNGKLARIRGKTSDTAGPMMPDLEDVYIVRICDPEAFFASTHPSDGGMTEFDSRLWVFKIGGEGVVGNDNKPGPPTVASFVNSDPTDASPGLDTPGLYLIGISGSIHDPSSSFGPGGAIFALGSPTEISGPDGPGGALPLESWFTIDGAPGVGSYDIALEGVTFGSTPSIDCNRNGIVDACDILAETSLDENFNGIPDECEEVYGDVNDDGTVDFADVLALLIAWGPCPGCPEDINGDGVVNAADLLIVLTSWS